MKYLKSHFWYNKSQRNGIFFLLSIVVILEILYLVFNSFYHTLQPNNNLDFNDSKLIAFKEQLDSLKILELENRLPKFYRFNPNYLTDSKASQLGMSLIEIDRLLNFRKQHKFVNSKDEFQNVTKVSDSLLNQIAVYFKFSDWVTKKNEDQKSTKKNFFSNNVHKSSKNRSVTTLDINKVTSADLQTINGVGEILAERILNYRNRIQGFTFKKQLYEVWNLERSTADIILQKFAIVERPVIVKINVNIATFKQVLSIPYIDYKLCKKIVEFREEVAELQSIDELKNIEGFPLDKYERITLYLMAE